MDVDKVLKRLIAKCDIAELRRTARALGSELRRDRHKVISQFRAGIARLRLEDPYLKGYLDAISDVTQAYQATALKLEEEQGLREFVKEEAIPGVPYRHLLKQLKEKPQTAKDLADYYYVEEEELEQPLAKLLVLWLVEGYGDKPIYRTTLYGSKAIE